MKTVAKMCVVASALTLVACGNEAGDAEGGEDWEPGGMVEIAVGASPGGGSDIAARSFAAGYEGQSEHNAIVENYEPVEGELRVFGEAGNGEILGMGNASNMIVQPVELDTAYRWSDFTQLAIMAIDINYVVSSSGEFESAEDMLEAADEDQLTIGQVSSGGSLELTINLLAEEFDINLQAVPFSGGGDLMRATVAGDVDLALSAPGAFLPYVESEEIDVLLSTGTDEYVQPQLSDVPLASELGAERAFPLFWRNIYGPPDLSEEQREYWVTEIENWTDTDEYAEFLETNALSEAFIKDEEMRSMMEQDELEFAGEVDGNN